MRRGTAELVAKLRDYDNCHDGDVDEAAARLEELQKIVDEIPRLVDLVVSHCGSRWVDEPSIYLHGDDTWSYHRMRVGDPSGIGNTPLEAVNASNRRKREVKVEYRAYLVVICDRESNAVIAADIWSSPEWEQSQYLDNITYVAYSTVGDSFEDARKEVLRAMEHPKSRYHWLLEHLNDRA
jgi:hypothetical protein